MRMSVFLVLGLLACTPRGDVAADDPSAPAAGNISTAAAWTDPESNLLVIGSETWFTETGKPECNRADLQFVFSASRLITQSGCLVDGKFDAPTTTDMPEGHPNEGILLQLRIGPSPAKKVVVPNEPGAVCFNQQMAVTFRRADPGLDPLLTIACDGETQLNESVGTSGSLRVLVYR